MNITTDDTLLKAANKAMRITVVIYVLAKQVTYNLMFEPVYWIPRAAANIVMLIIAFGLTRVKYLTKQQISWVIPLALALTEIILVASFGGDRLIYVFLTGCALMSLLYMDIRGLFITVSASCIAAAICLFVLGRTLIGEAYDAYDDIFNFMGLIVMDVLIFLIGKYGVGTLARSKKAAEEALIEAQDANRAKTNFLATMSHEIRTPMNAILGIAQLQLQEDDIPGKYELAANRIIDSGNTLLNIINDILDMSKIESGNMELVCAEFDVPGLINDAVQLNIVRLGSRPIKFILDIDENLPVKLCGDELRIKQVLNNLLSNAIKYTTEGHIRLSVKRDINDTVPAHDDEAALIITVEDTGQGILPEDCGKLFSAQYTRFNAQANRTTEGTGLGLSITKRLVELMNGDITVESEYGKGSIFTVAVKLKVRNPAPIGHETAARLRDFSFVDSKSGERRSVVRNLMPYGKVMVVDDVASNLFIAEGMLAKYKILTEAVNSGYKAIEKVHSGNIYDIIFMDHMMPNMDGIETTKRLREMGYSGVIIALTANALVGNDEMFRSNGFDGFISKPIDIKQLDTVLNKFIRDRHPLEAVQYKQQTDNEIDAEKPGLSKLHSAFCRDAAVALAALRESIAGEDTKKLIIAAHSMKSALINIGENDLSTRAAALERAGQEGDSAYVSENADAFIEALEKLVNQLGVSNEELEIRNEELIITYEDDALLKEQLGMIKNACEAYDDTAAYAALDRLREHKWKRETADVIEQIHDALYADSDFERAAELAAGLQA